VKLLIQRPSRAEINHYSTWPGRNATRLKLWLASAPRRKKSPPRWRVAPTSHYPILTNQGTLPCRGSPGF